MASLGAKSKEAMHFLKITFLVMGIFYFTFNYRFVSSATTSTAVCSAFVEPGVGGLLVG